MPKMDLAYVSCIGSENLETAYQKLIEWATPKGLMNEQAKLLTIFFNSFKTTPANKVQMSACLILNKPVETKGEIKLTSIEEGKCIVGSFEIGINEFPKSWVGMFKWMNENEYQKADKSPFEIYHNNFKEHPEKKCIVDFCIPII